MGVGATPYRLEEKMERLFSDKAEEIIRNVLKKGNNVEIKRERDNIVIVEIQRKALIKEPIK